LKKPEAAKQQGFLATKTEVKYSGRNKKKLKVRIKMGRTNRIRPPNGNAKGSKKKV